MTNNQIQDEQIPVPGMTREVWDGFGPEMQAAIREANTQQPLLPVLGMTEEMWDSLSTEVQAAFTKVMDTLTPEETEVMMRDDAVFKGMLRAAEARGRNKVHMITAVLLAYTDGNHAATDAVQKLIEAQRA